MPEEIVVFLHLCELAIQKCAVKQFKAGFPKYVVMHGL